MVAGSKARAACTAINPTGPQPTTAIESPFSMRASTAQSYAVVKMSPAKSARSSLIDGSTVCSARSAFGTRTYSACAPLTSPRNAP